MRLRTTLLVLAAGFSIVSCQKDAPTTAPDDAAQPQDGSSAATDDDSAASDDGPAGEAISTSVRTEGALTPDDVSAVVQLDAVQKCYQEAIERTYNEDLEGVVTIEFTIGKDGKVTDASPGKSNLGDAEAGECIIAIVKGLSFPAPSDGNPVEVVFPFEFKPY